MALPNVYLAGFGNHSTDAKAYQAAGLASESIFLIDQTSEIRVLGAGRLLLDAINEKDSCEMVFSLGYNDPRLWSWIIDLHEGTHPERATAENVSAVFELGWRGCQVFLQLSHIPPTTSNLSSNQS